MVIHSVQTWAHDLCTIGYLWDSINHNGWTCFVSQYAYFLSIVIFFILLWLRHCIGNKDYLTSEGHCWNTVSLFCVYWLRITNRSLANTRILIIAKKTTEFSQYLYQMATANLGIPSIVPFNTKGEPTSVTQRLGKWLKSFWYFVDASGTSQNNRKKLLFHLAGTNTQDIFETLTPTNARYEAALNTRLTKNILCERSILNQARQEVLESINQFITW